MIHPPFATLRRDGTRFVILDQTALPHRKRFITLSSLDDAARAIVTMQVRGAPLIGATAACGMALAMQTDSRDRMLQHAFTILSATRPTAVNLHWALARMRDTLQPLAPSERAEAARVLADQIMVDDATTCAAIGTHGKTHLRNLASGRPLRVMTHCNAGWIATCGIGTALAPVYAAHAAGLSIEVLASETRPRNQGLLTAWELAQAGVACTLIADNSAGLLLARGEVDLVIVGADRIAANGDTANKIGTYLKALAARAAGIPFYVAAPVSTIDAECPDGKAIPIEDRDGDEVRIVSGLDDTGEPARVRLAPGELAIRNPAFDVTPADLIDGLITELGVCNATQAGRLVA